MIVGWIQNRLRDIGPAGIPCCCLEWGRSGTTWAANGINYDHSHRVVFEPFLSAKTPEAAGFDYFAYLNPERRPDGLEAAARRLLAGKVHNRWVNRGEQGYFNRQRIVKDIRTNLMLGWLHAIEPEMKIVLMIRHPLQVIDSMLQLEWKVEAFGSRTNFETLISQKALLADFPLIAEVAASIDPEDAFQDVLFQWCVLHFVPLHQLRSGDAYLLFYENLLVNPEEEIARLFGYLNRDYEWPAVQRSLRTGSTTNYRDRDFETVSQSDLLASWRGRFSEARLAMADEMLSKFGLDQIYDETRMPSGWSLRS